MDYHQLPFFAESWNVAYRKRNGDAILEELDPPFTVIRNSTRFWAADPFVFEYGKEVYIFAELYDYIKKRGIIGYYHLNGKKSRWIPVISEAYHLSFPFVFQCDGQIYIMPESSDCGEVCLYRAVEFPDKWEKSIILRSGVRYVDSTPFVAFGRRMALTYDLSDPCLRVLDFSGEQDEIVDSSDPELKRPAGFIDFQRGFRVAQNCKEGYGKGLIFYRFRFEDRLTYREEEAFRVFPEELTLSKRIYLDGMHTYNASENYEVVDIKTRRFNLLNLCCRILSKKKR